MVEGNNGHSEKEITFTDVKEGFLNSVRRNKGKLMVLLVIIAVLSLVGGMELLHYSSSPGFCILFCHEMKPEHRTWSESVHAKNGVECKECHMIPGIIGLAKAKWAAKAQMIAHFSGSLLENTMEKAKKEGVFLEIQNIHQKGDKRYYIKANDHAIEVVNHNCNRCHPGMGEKAVVSETRGVRVAHEVHVGQKEFECTECHISIVHGEDLVKRNLPKMRICFRCHNQEDSDAKLGQTNCRNCHIAQEAMWAGISAPGIEVIESPMYGEVDCTDCHLEENGFQKPKSSAICLDCHEEDQVEIFHSWKNKLKVKRLKLKERIDTVEEKFNYAKEHNTSPQERANIRDAEKIFLEAKRYLHIVNVDGSNGIHNNEYALALLDVARKKVQESLRILP